jgi:radical SAM superfamily enzyme YgiQ (UPF0313 family)
MQKLYKFFRILLYYNKMNVTLINPPITAGERYGSVVKEGGGRQAPLGICYIAAVLEKNGINVSVIDAEAESLSYEQVIQRMERFKTNFVGITSTTVAFHRALELAKLIKEEKKDLFVLIGGPHISSIPMHAMAFDCFDAAVYGEGEYTTLDVVNAVKDGKSIKNIPGVVYRENGEVKLSERREYIEDLDELPYPARHLLPDKNLYNPPPMNYLKRPVLSVVTSRGCPNQCIFCDKAVFGNRFRFHSAKRIVDEIEFLIKEFGAKEISIVDDTFTVNKDRVFEFCRLMRERKVKIHWNARISENTVTKEMLVEMKEAGCWYLEIGVETGNLEVMKFIRKGTTLEKIREIVTWADKLGMVVKGFFIIGHEIDTEDTLKDTINFAKSIPLTDVVVTIMTPFPNTEAYNVAEKYGKFIHKQDYSKFNAWEVVYVGNNLTEDKLKYYWKKMYKDFYFRPITVWRHLKHLRDFTALKRYMRGVKVLLKTFV